MRNTPTVGPSSRPMPRVLGGGLGGWAFSYGRGTPVPGNEIFIHVLLRLSLGGRCLYSGTSLIRKHPPLKDHHMSICVGLP